MSFIVALSVRALLVVLFLPFSALDKILNFQGAVGQAQELIPSRRAAGLMILMGCALEVAGPLAILTGLGDRLAALAMAGYCAATAVLFKRWWTTGDLFARGASRGRDLFWDFAKNFSLAGGFLLLTFGLHAGDAAAFFKSPLASSHPYSNEGSAP